jgi:hypothetical protein
MRPARIALLVLILLLAGCNRATIGEKLPSGILYQDNFDADTGNWLLESDMDANSSFAEGRLQLEITDSNLIAWAELKERQFDDFVLRVDATQLAGPDNNSYGVIMRMKSSSAYYRFDISGDGYYAFTRRDEDDGGTWVWITEDWLESEAIHKGNSTNKIKIDAQKSHFSFYVNDQLIAEADDDTYRSGLIGLNAGSFHESGVKIGFDNLTVSELE